MFDSNKYYDSCSFSEQIVSFIYDEMIDSEKASFTEHISQCVSCSEEVAAFGNVHSEIVNWKREEFLPLQTPEIRIPYETTKIETKKPIFAGIFDFLSLSQGWLKPATAFAMLAIISAVAFLVFKNKPTGPTLAGGTPISSPKPSPTQQVNPVDTKVNEPKTVEKPVIQDAPSKAIPAAYRVPTKQKATRSTLPAEKPNVKTTPAKPKVKRKESVNLIQSDEDEDDSVRLSDLFDEISMK